jgi:hypothetical protein
MIKWSPTLKVDFVTPALRATHRVACHVTE